jgi:hypothetical protein
MYLEIVTLVDVSRQFGKLLIMLLQQGFCRLPSSTLSEKDLGPHNDVESQLLGCMLFYPISEYRR